MTQTTNKISAKTAIELLPPSVSLRVGRARLTMSWRARLRLPSLLSGLLQRAWKRVLAPSLRVSVAAAAVCGAWQVPAMAAAPAAGTLPTGWSVVNGNVTFTQNGNTLNINQLSPQAIANFLSFSIGSDATVNISQPSSLAALLARVTGGDISQIYGKLTAPGTVILYNPNGLVIGPGGVVDVGRFIGTTLNISDSDFLAGKYNFAKDGIAGNVDNQGTIQSATGGSVYLIGSNVSNSGIIKSAGGEVILAAGETVTLADTATPGVTVNVTGSAGSVTNLGTITADAGRIGVAAGLITNSGVISASSAVKQGGRIFLRAAQSLNTTASSSISADGTTGGNITLYSSGSAYIDGDVSATGSAGAGGYVETSGLTRLDVIKAPVLGSGGTWYIDPYDLQVVSENNVATDVNTTVGGVISSVGNSSVISNGTINNLLNGNTSVVLATTGVAGLGGGNITIDADIVNSNGVGVSLTLNADANINLNANITSSKSAMAVNLNTNYRDLGDSSNQVTLSGAHSINTNGGDLTISNGSTGNGNGALELNGCATVNMSGGGTMKVGALTVGSFNSVTLGNNASLIADSLYTYSEGHVDADGAALFQVNNITNIGNITLNNVSNATVANFTNQGNVTLTNTTFTVGSGGFDNQYNGTLSTGGATNIVLNGDLINSYGGNISFGGADDGAGSTNITGSGTLTLNGGYMTAGGYMGWNDGDEGYSAHSSGFNHTLNMSNAGGLVLTGGNFTLNSSLATVKIKDLTITSGDDVSGTVNVSNGSLSVSNQTVISQSGELDVYGGSVTLNGSVGVTDNAYVSVSGGNLTASNLTLGTNMTVNASSNVNLTGVTTVGAGGNLTVNGGNLSASNLALSANLTANSGSNVTLSGDTTVDANGYLSANGGNLTASNLALSGNMDVNSGSNVSLNGNAAVNASGYLSVNGGSLTASNLTLAGSGYLDIYSGSAAVLNGNTTIGTGTTVYNSGSTLTLNGNATLNGSLKTVGSATTTVNANLSGSGLLQVGYIESGGCQSGFSSFVVTEGGPSLTLNNVASSLDVRMGSGTLNLNGSARVSKLTLSGGAVTGITGSRLVVSDSFSQSSSASMVLADAQLTQSCGTLAVGNITATNLVLQASNGNISQNDGSSLHVTKQLIASATSGIDLSGANGTNQIAAFAANNSGTGNITLVNSLNTSDTSAVTLNGVSAANGNINIDNTGAMRTTAIDSNASFLGGLPSTSGTTLASLGINSTGQVKATTGNVTLQTHSPLTIGSGGVSASGNIALTAGAANDPSSNLVTNGVLSGGNVNLVAGNNLTVNANVVASGSYSTSATGTLLYGSGVSYTVNGVTTTPNPAAATATTSNTNTAVSQSQSQQAQNVNQVGSGQSGSSDGGGDVQQSGGSSQSSGGTGTFGDEGESKSGKKPLPMCT